ncbi:MAG: dihydropteroate synthase [Bacteroidales bacterium]|nr:dihydropteroate synthase [Bacteroidales bacterium]
MQRNRTLLSNMQPAEGPACGSMHNLLANGSIHDFPAEGEAKGDMCNMPVVMGIINVNEESFYSASRCSSLQSFSRQLEQMLSSGAGIIDIGACSTRPGSTPITLDQEWKLLKEPLEHVAKSGLCAAAAGVCPPRISIDTFRSEIVRRAYDTIGDFIVNDISAGEDDPQMLPVVGRLGLEYIAMHKRGTPSTMQQLCDYPRGVVQEVAEYFLKFEKRAAECGIGNYIVDPGFGFAKSVEQNYELFMGMPQLMDIVSGDATQSDHTPAGINSIGNISNGGNTGKCGSISNGSSNSSCSNARGISSSNRRRLLVGISRKSMIYKPLGITPESSLCATAALNLQALMLGADILRVHDVKEAVECVKLYQLLKK